MRQKKGETFIIDRERLKQDLQVYEADEKDEEKADEKQEEKKENCENGAEEEEKDKDS